MCRSAIATKSRALQAVGNKRRDSVNAFLRENREIVCFHLQVSPECAESSNIVKSRVTLRAVVVIAEIARAKDVSQQMSAPFAVFLVVEEQAIGRASQFIDTHRSEGIPNLAEPQCVKRFCQVCAVDFCVVDVHEAHPVANLPKPDSAAEIVSHRVFKDEDGIEHGRG